MISAKTNPLLVIGGILITLGLVGYGVVYTQSHSTVLIGLSLSDEHVPRWQQEANYMGKYMSDIGVDLLVENAREDGEAQAAQIDELLSKDVSALLVVPVDPETLYDVLVKAYKKSIPLIAYDRLLTDVPLDYYVTIDMRDVGSLAAEELAAREDVARILYVGGSPTDNNAFLHKQGFEDALATYSDKDFEIVGSWFTEGWRNDVAAEEMQSFIDSGVSFDVIVAGNDGLAGATSEVARKNDIPIKFVSGGDGDSAACERIVSGEQTMTVYKSSQKLAEGAAQLALDLASGKRVDAQRTTNNGVSEVPTYTVDPILITKEIIDAGVFNSSCELQE